MKQQCLLVIDIQNDITKNYKGVIQPINTAIDWFASKDMPIIYMRHEDLSKSARRFRPHTLGSELAPDLHIKSTNLFTKHKQNVLTSPEFEKFIIKNRIKTFYITGGDANFCLKSTCYNLRKKNYAVTVLKDCITSYDTSKIIDMLSYYENKGCHITDLNTLIN